MFHHIARRLVQPTAAAAHVSRRWAQSALPQTPQSAPTFRKKHASTEQNHTFQGTAEKDISKPESSPVPENTRSERSSIIGECLDAAGVTQPIQDIYTRQDLIRFIRTASAKDAWNAYRYLQRTKSLVGVSIQDYNGLISIIKRRSITWGSKNSIQEQIKRIKDIIATMRSYGVEPNTPTYVSIATCYALAGQVHKVQEILDIIASKGWEPPRTAKFLMLTAKAYSDPTEAHNELKESLEQKEISSAEATGPYNALLESAVKAKKADVVYRTLQLGKNFHILPDSVTYDILIEYFAAVKGDMKEAWALLKKKKDHGYTTSTRAYNSILRGLFRLQRNPEVFQVFKRMEEEGVSANTVTYNLMLSVYAKLNNPLVAMRLYLAMLTLRIPPNRSTHAALSRSVAKHVGGLRHLITRAGGFPSRAVYKAMVEGFMEDRKPAEALSVIDQYRAESRQNPTRWPLTLDLLNDELTCLSRLERVEQAEHIWKHDFQTIQPNLYSYNALIAIYSKPTHRNPARARELYQGMRKDGIRPGLFTFNGLLRTEWSGQEPLNEKALEYLRDFATSGIDSMGMPRTQAIRQGLELIGNGDYLQGLELLKCRQEIDLSSLPQTYVLSTAAEKVEK